ncbi:hypothetical protein ACTA71_001946 [Dictyostelium dimigraforme]
MEEIKLILWNFRDNNKNGTKKQNNQENSFSGFEDIYDHMETTAAASAIISKTDAEEMEKQPPNKSNNNQSQPSIVKINKSQKYLKTRNPRNNRDSYDIVTAAATAVIFQKPGNSSTIKKNSRSKHANRYRYQKEDRPTFPRSNKRLVDRIYCYPSLLGGNHINFQFMDQPLTTTNHNTFQTQQQQLNKPKNQHHNTKQTRKITLVIN